MILEHSIVSGTVGQMSQCDTVRLTKKADFVSPFFTFSLFHFLVVKDQLADPFLQSPAIMGHISIMCCRSSRFLSMKHDIPKYRRVVHCGKPPLPCPVRKMAVSRVTHARVICWPYSTGSANAPPVAKVIVVCLRRLKSVFRRADE